MVGRLWLYQRIICLGVSCRCPSGLRDCLVTSQTVWGSSAGAPPVSETVWHRQILYESLLPVPRRYWHRRRPSLSILLVIRRSGKLSCTIETVWESPAGVKAVSAPS
ncbi:hypothetical protein DPMN_098125 [Dreissena polymorpha]|uniref:Uncharacterized protein n=1 Tax=Dreissena polymorpha TaxID=45954 RepID=A0A9D4R6D1_DREPO|nr:hypothetical protein DPMN_098125 [Dreissena polymorpha]